MIHGTFTTFLVIISFIFITAISVKLYPKIYGKSIMPTGCKFFLLNYVIFIYIGVFLMNIFHFDRLEYANIYSSSLADKLLPMYLLGIITLPLFFAGSWVSNTVFKYKSTASENVLLEKERIITNNNYYKSPFFVFLTILLIFFILYVLRIYISRLGTLPIMASLMGEYNVSEFRSAATNDFEGKKYRFNIILQTLPLYFFIFYYLIRDKRTVHKIITIVLLCICIFSFVMDGVKGLLIQFLLLILLLQSFSHKFLSLKKIMIFGCIAFILMCTMYMFFMGQSDRSLSEIVVMPISRIFLGSSWSMLYYLDYVPAHSDYLLGQSFPNPGGIFPYEWRRIPVEIAQYYEPGIALRGVVGSSPATFYGDFYLNFGYIGALFSMMFFGFLLKTIDIFFIRKIKGSKLSFPLLALFFIYIHIVGTYSRTSFMGLLFDPGLLLLILISLTLILLNALHNKSRYQR